MSAAKIASGATVPTQLDRRVADEIRITAKDVADAETLARLVQAMTKRIADLERRWNPACIDFEDLPVSGTADIRLNHGMNGRVRWWLGQWKPTSVSANNVPLIAESSSTTADVLVLSNLDPGIGRFAGTVTIRVEAAG